MFSSAKVKCVVLGLLFSNASFAQKVEVDPSYCDGVALLAKAGIEAKRRGESLQDWRNDLLAMNRYMGNNQGNILNQVLPRAIKEANVVYASKKTPTDAYVSTFESCMKTEYGLVVTL